MIKDPAMEPMLHKVKVAGEFWVSETAAFGDEFTVVVRGEVVGHARKVKKGLIESTFIVQASQAKEVTVTAAQALDVTSADFVAQITDFLSTEDLVAAAAGDGVEPEELPGQVIAFPAADPESDLPTGSYDPETGEKLDGDGS